MFILSHDYFVTLNLPVSLNLLDNLVVCRFQSKSLQVGDSSIIFSPPSIVAETLPDDPVFETKKSSFGQCRARFQVLPHQSFHSALVWLLSTMMRSRVPFSPRAVAFSISKWCNSILAEGRSVMIQS